ncbi:MAG: CehA/McbA family metallohydrolase [Acidobacteriota bacterium]
MTLWTRLISLGFCCLTLDSGSALVAERVRVVVTDAETGQTVAARAYLKCGGQAVFPAGAPAYRRGAEEHFLLSGDDSFDLPSSPCELTVARGLEYEPARLNFKPAAGLSVSVSLRRWVSMNQSGWFSADMHVHRDPRELGQILPAEDLNFAPTITYHVWSERASQPFPNAAAFPVIVDESHFFTANSEEVERIQGGPGAVVLMARDLPIPFQGDEYYPPAAHFTRQAHRQGGYVSGDKLFWLDTYVNVALGEIDFIEINCNHFLPHDVDTDLIPWSHWPVEMGYYGDLEFAHWMMDFYYQILNCGLTLPLSGGCASGVKATPVGYDRVYVYLEKQPFTYDNFMRALKEGRSFSTNGPIIDFRINGKVAPGSRADLQRREVIGIDAVVRSRKGLDRVELIVNGKVWRTYPAAGKLEFRASEKLQPEVSSWVAVRAFEPSDETLVFAHTSPAYVLLDRRPVRFPADARAILAKVDQLICYTETKAKFRTPEQKAETLALYREARAVYEKLATDPSAK